MVEISERMNAFLLNDKKESRVAFGSTLDRELLPLKTPHTRAGNEMGLRGVPNLGPGSYNNDQVSSFVHGLNQKPVGKKGYSLGARTAQRFSKKNNDYPGPPTHQKTVTKLREFPPAQKPFQCGASRFPQLRVDFTPGPGCYEFDTARDRKVQFHGSFGGTQILKSPVTLICNKDEEYRCMKSGEKPVGDFWMNNKKQVLSRPSYEAYKQELSEKERTKFLDKFFKVRDCTDRHEHEGTNAKLRLMSDKDIEKIRRREAYLSLYY